MIHVGANDGGERFVYDEMGLHVLWVEPIPTVFAALEANIAGFPQQRAIQALLAEADGEPVEFLISSNGGKSSSMHSFAKHSRMFPWVTVQSRIDLTTTTLDTVVRNEQIDMSLYDCLLLDTQGSELRVLEGAERTIAEMKCIIAEAATFESYSGAAQAADVIGFLRARGFRVTAREPFAYSFGLGTYFNIRFERA